MSLTTSAEPVIDSANQNRGIAVRGRLVFSDSGRPVHAIEVSLVNLSPELLLGTTRTNEDGLFAIPFNPDTMKTPKSIRKLELRVHEQTISYSATGDLVETPRVVFS